MNTILRYLKDPVIPNTTKRYDIPEDKLKYNYQKLVKLYNQNIVPNKKVQLKIIPKTIKSRQIWLCKKKYIDYLGNDIQGVSFYYILIVSEPEILEDTDTEFVRIQPISMFTEFQTFDDILVDDASITGFPFLIETWNEQPVLTSVLEEYITDLNDEAIKINEQLPFTNEQKEFREIEVNNTAYLRQSVISVLSWLENKQEESSGVVINLFGEIYYPSKSEEDLLDTKDTVDFAVAAKKRFKQSRDKYIFHQEVDGFMITIKAIKDVNKYIVVLVAPGESEIIDAVGKRLQGIRKNEKQIFKELEPGIYEFANKNYNESIKIRLQ